MLRVDEVLQNPKWQSPFWLKAKALKAQDVLRPVSKHQKEASTCKTQQTNWFIALLWGLAGGA